jgi:hypothetical protein
MIWCWSWMNGSQGGAYRARLSIGFRLASSTERPRSRARTETPGYVVRSRPVHSRRRIRPCHKSAQDIIRRPSVVRASWTIEVRKEGITAGTSSYFRKPLGNGRSTPILFFTWECLSSKPAKRPKRVVPSIERWPAASRSLSRPKQNKPSRPCSGSRTTPSA